MIIDILTIIGLTYIITRSDIFKPLREFLSKKNDFLGDLFSCPLCMGVWVGAFIWFSPIIIKDFASYIGIGGISCYIIFLLIEKLKN